MRVHRSGSQILFGHLPEQTIDAEARVWRVVDWQFPGVTRSEDSALRDELVRQADPWAATGSDSHYVRELQAGTEIQVLSLNREAGVRVEPFPEIWKCRKCNRLVFERPGTCKCGARSFGQLHFVAFHHCGRLEAPYIPRCPQHGEVCMVQRGSSSIWELRFECPMCRKQLSKGFLPRRCDCGGGTMEVNVHRAARVFSPRNVVIVNAVDDELRTLLKQAGGPRRALDWVLAGMTSRDFTKQRATRDTLVADLLAKGISAELAEQMAEVAAAQGGVQVGGPLELKLDAPVQREAERQAATVATALYGARMRLEEVASTLSAGTLADDYAAPIARAGLETVELCDRFPVLTGAFGFTRGGHGPGETTLVPFRAPKGSALAVYAERAETEALWFRLDPLRVLDWLRSRHHELPALDDGGKARVALLQAAEWPRPGSDPSDEPGIGEEIVTLVHSFSHRVLRRAAALAGIERESLAELLVPAHLGFFLYAAARGDFVLGGLQAMFERDLDRLLDEVVFGEHRCAMDPGCTAAGAACACCLHTGEPSCRMFNSFLDRRLLKSFLDASRKSSGV